jgi:hypothetical protein
MNLIMLLYVALLAFALSPGVLVSLPPGADKTTTALTHAVVLAVVYAFTHALVFKMFAK